MIAARDDNADVDPQVILSRARFSPWRHTCVCVLTLLTIRSCVSVSRSFFCAQDQDDILGTDCPFASGMYAEVMLWVSQQQAHCRAMWAENDAEEDDGDAPNLAATSHAYGLPSQFAVRGHMCVVCLLACFMKYSSVKECICLMPEWCGADTNDGEMNRRSLVPWLPKQNRH